MHFPITTAIFTATFFAGALSNYAPVSTACPSTPLVRTATGLSHSEESYRVARKAKTELALTLWLKKTNKDFQVTSGLPIVALASSGGGYRALMVGAGVIQALDARDSKTTTSGLYQGLSYHSAVSGGAWLLSSIASNNFATISSLLPGWETAFSNGLFNPQNNSTAAFAEINQDIVDKKGAGYRGTVADAWSRLLSYQLLPGANGGVKNTLSQLTGLSNFISRNTPYPIILAQNVDLSGTSCIPPLDAPLWEYTPYEFGSWDPRINTFTPTAFLGSALSGGAPQSSNSCITNYDNLGFVLGTSSSLFNDPVIGVENPPEVLLSTFCTGPTTGTPSPSALEFTTNIYSLLYKIPEIQFTQVSDLFASWPNPFYNLSTAPLVSAQETLAMVDGGESGQVNPIFPFLLPERKVSVILVNDNDADTAALYPNGAELRNTYEAAMVAGLTRMPFIPTADVLIAQNRTFAPVFFGCNDNSTSTIVWIPNAPLTAAGGAAETTDMQFNKTKTDSLVANGAAVMSQNNSSSWATCLGCAIMKDTGSKLPAACAACFTKYCFQQ